MIASPISSPPTRIDCETTIPPSEITATSEVAPPMSTTIEPVGSPTGKPAPIAARRQGGLLDRPLPPPGDARRHTHDHARVGKAVLVDLLDEVPQHLLGHVEVRDHPILQRPDRLDRAGGAPEHPLRLDPHGVHLARARVDRHHARLGKYD